MTSVDSAENKKFQLSRMQMLGIVFAIIGMGMVLWATAYAPIFGVPFAFMTGALLILSLVEADRVAKE